jgi:general secretion pathway protein G
MEKAYVGPSPLGEKKKNQRLSFFQAKSLIFQLRGPFFLISGQKKGPLTPTLSPEGRGLVKGSRGSSLVEMMVVLVILAILTSVAAPYARRTIQREKEFTLKETLRTVRRAIDAFHTDWEKSKTGSGDATKAASPDGYPVTLKVLVDGVETGSAAGKKKRYLRALPKNPLLPPQTRLEDQWIILGYQDDPKSKTALGKDVYDIHPKTEEKALDGTKYVEW